MAKLVSSHRSRPELSLYLQPDLHTSATQRTCSIIGGQMKDLKLRARGVDRQPEHSGRTVRANIPRAVWFGTVILNQC
jgi:hypothetical protein